MGHGGGAPHECVQLEFQQHRRGRRPRDLGRQRRHVVQCPERLLYTGSLRGGGRSRTRHADSAGQRRAAIDGSPVVKRHVQSLLRGVCCRGRVTNLGVRAPPGGGGGRRRRAPSLMLAWRARHAMLASLSYGGCYRPSGTRLDEACSILRIWQARRIDTQCPGRPQVRNTSSLILEALTRSRCNSGPAIRAISLQTKAFPIVRRSCFATVRGQSLGTGKSIATSGFKPSRQLNL